MLALVLELLTHLRKCWGLLELTWNGKVSWIEDTLHAKETQTSLSDFRNKALVVH
jgi:hypothetical protein